MPQFEGKHLFRILLPILALAVIAAGPTVLAGKKDKQDGEKEEVGQALSD